jgi:hypothetical protein
VTVEELATQLATALSGTEGDDVFLGGMPPLPHLCSSVRETGGFSPVYVLGQAAPAFHRPTAQFNFRGVPGDQETPRTNAKTAFDAFIALQNTNLTNIRFYLFTPMQEVFPSDYDDQERYTFTFNMQFLKDPS